jgi:branched-chain amino acid transport system substrate-binding protein
VYDQIRTLLARRPLMTLPRVAAVLVVLTLASLLYQSVPAQSGSGPGHCGDKIAYLSAGGDDQQPILESATLAVDQYDATHPNCTVSLVEYSTRSPQDDDLTANAANQIVSDPKVLGVIGPITGDEANVALPILDQAGIVLISPTLRETVLGGQGFRVFHRVVGNTDDDTAAAIQWLTRTVKANKVFVIDDAFEETAANAKTAMNLLGATAAGAASVDDPGGDHSALIAKISASRATAVYYSGHPQSFTTLAPEIHAARPDITIVGAHWVVDGIAKEATIKPTTKIYATNPNTLPSQAGSSFTEQFLSRYNTTAGYYGPEGYDAANIMLSGIAADKLTRAGLLSWVHTYKGQGATGAIAFKPNGDRTNPTVVLLRVSNGQFYAPQVIAGGGV